WQATPQWARLDSNQRLLVCKTSARPSELLAQRLRDKDSNLDLHVQSVVSCRLDDPGTSRPRQRQRFSAHLPASGEIDAGAGRFSRLPDLVLCLVRAKAERCFPSLSPTLRPWIADRRLRTLGAVRRPTWRSFGARASNAGRNIAG